MEGTFCAPSFLTVQEKFFRRKAYVFKCNAAAACQWYGGFCRDFCSDITFFTSAGTSDLLWQNVQESGDTWNCVCLHISYAWNPVNAAIDGVYFGPYFIFGIRISMGYSLIAVFIAFSINYAAYFAEIYRGGIESISAGQYEAAKILGYSKAQTFFRIILPQVIKRILPSVTNEVITLVKDTSLAFVVAVSEMFTIAKQIASAQTTMMPFVIAAVFYFVFNLLVAIVMDKIEKKLNYYR